jgi:hypothetical protein
MWVGAEGAVVKYLRRGLAVFKTVKIFEFGRRYITRNLIYLQRFYPKVSEMGLMGLSVLTPSPPTKLRPPPPPLRPILSPNLPRMTRARKGRP